MIKPKQLHPGDKVAAVSLSWGGAGTFPHRYQAGKKQLEDTFGVELIEMPNTLRDAQYLAQNPQARADDLMQAFADPSIKGIISTIGGDDSLRLLPYMDLDVIREHPKVFMGYSDTTITHLVCYRAGLVSFYGPAIMAGFAENGGLFAYMQHSVQKTLFTNNSIGMIEENKERWCVKQWDWADPANQEKKRETHPCTGWRYLQGKGKHSGHLLGGCFEVFDFLRGSDYFPGLSDWEDAILFLDLSEEAPPPLALKRGLRVYGALGILEQVNGLLLGRPGGEISVGIFKEYDQVILEVVRDELGLANLPIITNMDYGHTDPMFVLPYGVTALIDCDEKSFSIIENAVM